MPLVDPVHRSLAPHERREIATAEPPIRTVAAAEVIWRALPPVRTGRDPWSLPRPPQRLPQRLAFAVAPALPGHAKAPGAVAADAAGRLAHTGALAALALVALGAVGVVVGLAGSQAGRHGGAPAARLAVTVGCSVAVAGALAAAVGAAALAHAWAHRAQATAGAARTPGKPTVDADGLITIPL